MSRIGNKTITIPAGVEVTVAAGNEVTVKGPKGTLTRQFNENMQIDVNGNEIKVVRPNDEKHIKQLHGTTRALLHNMVVGVSEGFTRELEVVGIGFRAAVSGVRCRRSARPLTDQGQLAQAGCPQQAGIKIIADLRQGRGYRQ